VAKGKPKDNAKEIVDELLAQCFWRPNDRKDVLEFAGHSLAMVLIDAYGLGELVKKLRDTHGSPFSNDKLFEAVKEGVDKWLARDDVWRGWVKAWVVGEVQRQVGHRVNSKIDSVIEEIAGNIADSFDVEAVAAETIFNATRPTGPFSESIRRDICEAVSDQIDAILKKVYERHGVFRLPGESKV